MYRRWWLRLLVLVCVIYVAWCTLLYFAQDRLVFPAALAPRPLDSPPSRVVVDRFTLPEGGEEYAWFWPAPSQTAATPIVMYFHGNGEVIDFQEMAVEGYQRLGCSVLLPEYRGYGRAAGSPSEEGIVADCVQFYDRFLARTGTKPERVFFHGRSLGGGVAAQVAARRKPAALIIEESFTSVATMSHKYLAPSFLARHPFRTDRVLPDIAAPLLIFHGTRDSVIPVAHGRRLHEIRPDARYVEYDSDHIEFPGPTNYTAFWSEIRAFLSRAGLLQ